MTDLVATSRKNNNNKLVNEQSNVQELVSKKSSIKGSVRKDAFTLYSNMLQRKKHAETAAEKACLHE